MANTSWDNGGGKPSKEFLGSMPDEVGPAHSRSWVWDSSKDSTESGDFGNPAWDEDSAASAPTIEENVPVTPPAAAKVSEPFPRAIGIEESGDYDLAPLRHLLEQDWADPRSVRSNADYQPTPPSQRPWHQEPAEVDTMEVKSAGEAPKAAPPAMVSLPSEADFPDLVFDNAPPMPPPPATSAPRSSGGGGLQRIAMAGAAVAAVAVLGAIPFLISGFKSSPEPGLGSETKPPVVAAVDEQPAPEPPPVAVREEPAPPPVEKPVPPKLADPPEEEKPSQAKLTDPPVEKLPPPKPAEPASAPVSLVTLDWSGLPSGSKVFWQGQRTAPDKLGSVKPGKYSLKVIAPSRPAVLIALQVGEASEPISVGEQVKEHLSKQPTLSLTLAKTPKSPVSVKVRELGTGATFKTTAKLVSKDRASVVLPKAGKYKVEVSENDVYQAYGQTVDFQDGSKKSLQIALKSAPIPVASAPAATYSNSGGTGGGYSPPPPVYHAPPPPAYYGGGGNSGGGGGGGGRIAPPSF